MKSSLWVGCCDICNVWLYWSCQVSFCFNKPADWKLPAFLPKGHFQDKKVTQNSISLFLLSVKLILFCDSENAQIWKSEVNFPMQECIWGCVYLCPVQFILRTRVTSLMHYICALACRFLLEGQRDGRDPQTLSRPSKLGQNRLKDCQQFVNNNNSLKPEFWRWFLNTQRCVWM